MKKIKLHNTDIETTSLGFGCAGLMRSPSRRSRQRLLASAYDGGVMHFDVARMYGLGRAEEELGRFLRGRRNDVVVSTKFGIEVNRVSGLASLAQGLGRRVLSMVPALRRVVSKHSGSFYAPKNFDIATARRNLEESLRALGTDYIDIFLLHEPELADVTDTEILGFLQDARNRGMIRAWGVAGYPDQVIPVIEEFPQLAGVIQVPNDIEQKQLEKFSGSADSAFITFSPYSGVLEKISQRISDGNTGFDSFIEESGMDVRIKSVLARLLLSYCLQSNHGGVTLFSSGRIGGVRENIAAWHDPCPEKTVRAFSELVSGLAK